MKKSTKFMAVVLAVLFILNILLSCSKTDSFITPISSSFPVPVTAWRNLCSGNAKHQPLNDMNYTTDNS